MLENISLLLVLILIFVCLSVLFILPSVLVEWIRGIAPDALKIESQLKAQQPGFESMRRWMVGIQPADKNNNFPLATNSKQLVNALETDINSVITTIDALRNGGLLDIPADTERWWVWSGAFWSRLPAAARQYRSANRLNAQAETLFNNYDELAVLYHSTTPIQRPLNYIVHDPNVLLGERRKLMQTINESRAELLMPLLALAEKEEATNLSRPNDIAHVEQLNILWQGLEKQIINAPPDVESEHERIRSQIEPLKIETQQAQTQLETVAAQRARAHALLDIAINDARTCSQQEGEQLNVGLCNIAIEHIDSGRHYLQLRDWESAEAHLQCACALSNCISQLASIDKNGDALQSWIEHSTDEIQSDIHSASDAYQAWRLQLTEAANPNLSVHVSQEGLMACLETKAELLETLDHALAMYETTYQDEFNTADVALQKCEDIWDALIELTPEIESHWLNDEVKGLYALANQAELSPKLQVALRKQAVALTAKLNNVLGMISEWQSDTERNSSWLMAKANSVIAPARSWACLKSELTPFDIQYQKLQREFLHIDLERLIDHDPKIYLEERDGCLSALRLLLAPLEEKLTPLHDIDQNIKHLLASNPSVQQTLLETQQRAVKRLLAQAHQARTSEQANTLLLAALMQAEQLV